MANQIPPKNRKLSRPVRRYVRVYPPTHTAALGDFFNLSRPISKRGRVLLENRLKHDAHRNNVPIEDIQIIIEKMRRRIARHNLGFTQVERDLAEENAIRVPADILADGTCVLRLGFYYKSVTPTSERTHG
jgi:hypothetical protein